MRRCGTAFTVSDRLSEGLTTGISAHERAATVHALANSQCPGERLRAARPCLSAGRQVGRRADALGPHRSGGRPCEAGGLHPPVGVICELVNDDGTVKRGPQVLAFAREHGLKIISVADLIAYRQSRERLVERARSCEVATAAGPARVIAYRTPFDTVQHLAARLWRYRGRQARSRCGFIARISSRTCSAAVETLRTGL